MSFRSKVLIGNIKMNHNLDSLIHYSSYLKDYLDANRYPDCLIGIAPSYPHLLHLKQSLKNYPVFICAQDAHFVPYGSYTSAVSYQQLVDDGIKYTIIGHSESRVHFFNDDTIINKKIATCLSGGLKVIFCVGETLEQYNSNQTQSTLQSQLLLGLQGIDSSLVYNITIAYEPVWAIGSGLTPSYSQAQQSISFIRDYMTNCYGSSIGEQLLILYGGSVNESNITSFVSNPDIDGVLVGGASLKVESFCNMISSLSKL